MEIDKDKRPSTEAAELRRQAEERLLAKKAEFQPPRAEEETQRLVHELEVHQIELEMQNEMIRQTRDDLEKALDKYTDLYDFAPVAYFTLDHEGVVHTANLGSASLLGLERSLLPGRRFGLFVIGEDRAAFSGFLEKVFASEGKESCEVTLLGKGNRPLFVQIEAVAVASRQECRVAAIDITSRKQIEAELKQTNMQKELILASAGEGIIGLDLRGNHTFVNASAAAMLGFEVKELAGKQSHSTWHYARPGGTRYPAEECPVYAAYRDGTVHSGEEIFLRKDGTAFTVLFTSRPIIINGEITGAVLTFNDITERKQMEENLRESEQRFASFMLHLPAAAWMKDLAGRYVYANAEAERIFAMPLAALQGKTDEEIFPPETARQFRENDRRVLAGGRGIQTTESLQQANGILHHSIVSKFAVPGPDGQPAYVAGVAFDITEQIQAQTALRESEERLRALVTASSQVLYRMSPDWGEMLQLYSQEFLSSTENPSVTWLQEYIWPDDQPLVTAAIQEAIRTKSIFELEHRVRRSDGSLGWTASRAVPIMDANNEIVEWFGTANDITGRKQAEESLRFSEKRYRALFRDNPVMIVTLDADLTMLSVNPTCAGQLGYAIDELEGRSVLMLFLEDDRPAVAEQLYRCLQNPDQVHRWQYRKLRKDGGMIWVEETAQAIYDLNGSLNLLVVCQDITERKRAEEEREKLLVQLDAVLNSINEGVVIADLSGNILSMNSSALAFHEYATVEQVRQQLHQLQDTFEVSDLEGRPVPFEQWPLSRVLRGEQITDFELHVRRKDKGTSRIGSYSGTPVQTRSGDVILAVITVRDITERKRAEAEIQRLASFPLMNPNPVLELDADGQMTFCNPAAKHILEKGGYVTGINPLIPQEMPEILQALRNKKPGEFLRSIEIDGRFFEELVYVTPQFQTVRIYTMEITKRKQAEEEISKLNASLAMRAVELEDSNRELEAFNYTVAHDLRNPLNVISGYCQVIKELCSDKLDEQCKNYLRETYNGTLRMNRLIEALLQFSRLAHTELKRDIVDLSSMAREVAGELKLTGPERPVNFRIAEGISADGDASLLRVVLANLLGNAWKYTAVREEAVIEFAVTEIDGRPTYFVRDNGPGFDMKDADKLFTPFQRLPGAEECRGFGIGLATVERIIRRHGGQVWAEGAIGKGSTFYFTLPS